MMRTPSAKTAVTTDNARTNVRTPIRTGDLSAVHAANLTVGVALTVMGRVAENVTHNLRCSHSKLTAECYDLRQGSQPHLDGSFHQNCASSAARVARCDSACVRAAGAHLFSVRALY